MMQRRPNAGLKMGLGAVAVLFAAACGAGGGGGGGGGAAMTGGAPGSVCNTKYQSEGCVGLKKTGCVALPNAASPDAGEWKDLGDCTSSEYCFAEVNPSDAAKKIAVCKPLQTGGGTDTVGAGDGTTGGATTSGVSSFSSGEIGLPSLPFLMSKLAQRAGTYPGLPASPLAPIRGPSR